MNLLVADDHPMVRDALAQALGALRPAPLLRVAADLPGLLALLRQAPADLAVVDLNMPGMDGTAGLARLRAAAPTLPIVVASGQDDPATVCAVVAAGAAGFVSKAMHAEQLLQAVQVVLAGGLFVPPGALGALGARAAPAADLTALTPRQRDVLRALQCGQPNKLIARELGLTEGTVKIHIAAILRALQVRNRTEAVVRARALGFE